METSLIIMAAGIGSRYGAGIKQLAKMDSNDNTIMDYSIYDAKQAGFNKVIFIIRKDIEKDFKEVIGKKIEKQMKVEYVFQELDDLPKGFSSPSTRKKPWGTVQAILAAREKVNEPYLIINADDYYGKEAFVLMHDFLVNTKNKDKLQIGMPGFRLKNTLSDNGTVTRGVCISENNLLKSILETHEIEYKDGKIHSKENLSEDVLNLNTLVSMNMWASFPKFLTYASELFEEFLNENIDNLESAEFVLPTMIDTLIKRDLADIHSLPTKEKWIGITYKEDLKTAQDEFKAMLDRGLYPENLWK